MCNGHFLHPHQPWYTVPLHDPSHLRQQLRKTEHSKQGIWCWIPFIWPWGKMIRGGCRTPSPLRPELSIHFSRIFQQTKQYGITPSLSRRGEFCNNALEENFCSTLAIEYIWSNKPDTFSDADEVIGCYIYWYNHEHILLKTREVPLVRHLCAKK